jgi:opacity protein-like surface antigen|tara:strand:+ start:127 stop:726 length:600 start_codon:yes stop_codon:yes gene_type:complete
MKKFILALSMIGFMFNANAQDSEGASVATVGLGYSFFNNIIKNSLETYSDVEVKSVPTIALTYDFALTDNFSIGVAGAFQNVSGEFTNQYIDQNFDIQTEIATTKVSRLNIALRPLFHYGDGDRLDLYSGIRVGYLIRNVETETNDELLNVLGDLDGNRFALGLVPFGMRYFFTDNLGVNMDLQIGTPYVVSGGIAFTF